MAGGGAGKVVVLLVCIVAIRWSSAQQQEEECLMEFKASLNDPENYLADWKPGGNVCKFIGVTCYHVNEPSVYTLELPSASLSGSFPKGLSKCKYLQNLDLSGNRFSGAISPTLCTDVPVMVKLNLKNNKFDGLIPSNLGTCQYLNELYLEYNQLTGPIPDSIANLSRLNAFNVSHNRLSGIIPYSVQLKFNDSYQYTGNSGLCGPPLRSCNTNDSKNTGLIIGIVIGTVVGLLSAAGLIVWILLRPRKDDTRRDESRWVKRIKGPKSIVVSMFGKPLAKMKLSDLMSATKNFGSANIIAVARTGTMYRGTLPDGSVVAIKRLLVTPHSDKEFQSEMETLGRLKHRNLVPLLGYCIAGPERLLVYKHMANGSLQSILRGSQQITGSNDVEKGVVHNGSWRVGKPMEMNLDWPRRLKIAIGVSRGLAWLHHSCNPRVIHRNISPSSVLLDEEFEPAIFDFGLARLMNPVDTHITTFVNGDLGDAGYVAPELMRTLVATVKGDVYSFGVVLLELITGRKATDVAEENFRGNLAEWILFLNGTSSVASAIDRSLLGGDRDDELLQFMKIAASCVAPSPVDRPSVYEVFHMLRAIGTKYNITDQTDEIPLASSSGDVDGRETTVPRS